MLILAIETSCDDTCIAIVKARRGRYRHGKTQQMQFRVLSSLISSQVKIHRKYGGVYPALAKREHQKNLIPLLIQSLKQSKLLKTSSQISGPPQKNLNKKFQILQKILNNEKDPFEELKKFFIKYKKPKIDAIAVTVGPGLEPCLWVGVNFAKALAFWWKKPIVPINHIEAHILTNWLDLSISADKKNLHELFPAICLAVSGGHTELILMRHLGKYKILGETRDDAAGECLDKIARILKMTYPGGPAIAKQAQQWKTKYLRETNKFKIKLPRPMIHQKNYDFSFSGLKTAALYTFKNQPQKIKKSKKYLTRICFEVQQAIIDVLIHKTLKSLKDFKAKSIILGGGVAANKELRKQFRSNLKSQRLKVKILFPPRDLCTDNAVMVGISGLINWAKRKNWKFVRANSNLKI